MLPFGMQDKQADTSLAATSKLTGISVKGKKTTLM